MMRQNDYDKAANLIRHSHEQFSIALHQAQGALEMQALQTAAIWAQIAADYASHRHPGYYASPDLEKVLLSIAERLPWRKSRWKEKAEYKESRRILHILSSARSSGGHTRAVDRWIRITADKSVHSVITTSQKQPLPRWLASSIKESGGWHKNLYSSGKNVLGRAVTLRRVARSWADLIVLHTDMSDVVPIIAFGVSGGPPVLYFNHADHLFWIGGTIADVVADIRDEGRDLTIRRRGVRRSSLLPVPITDDMRTLDSLSARRQLGISSETIVMLSIGAAYKFVPFGELDFMRSVREVLVQRPNAVLIVVGPDEKHIVTEKGKELHKRIKAVGTQSNIDIYHQSADIYLDPFPVGSMTALLEACRDGIPALSIENARMPMFSSYRLGGREPDIHMRNVQDYQNRLVMLIDDRAQRVQQGKRLKEYIRERHRSAAWKCFYENVLSSMPSVHEIQPLKPCAAEHGVPDLYLAGFQSVASPEYTMPYVIRRNCRYFPLMERLMIRSRTMRAFGEKIQVPIRELIGERVLSFMRTVKQSVLTLKKRKW